MGENFGNLIWNWIDSDTQRQRWNLFKQTYWFLSTVLSFSISITDCFESTFLLAMPRTVSWRIFCHWHYYVHLFLLFSTSTLPHWLDKHKEIRNKDSNHWRWFSSTFSRPSICRQCLFLETVATNVHRYREKAVVRPVLVSGQWVWMQSEN